MPSIKISTIQSYPSFAFTEIKSKHKIFHTLKKKTHFKFGKISFAVNISFWITFSSSKAFFPLSFLFYFIASQKSLAFYFVIKKLFFVEFILAWQIADVIWYLIYNPHEKRMIFSVKSGCCYVYNNKRYETK